MNVMFFIVLLILVLLGIRGYKRGLLGIVFGVVAWIFILVFIQWASPKAYENLSQDEKIVSTISNGVENLLQDKAEDITVENADEELSEDKVNALSNFLPEGTMDKYNELMSNLEDFNNVSSTIEDSALKQEMEDQANEVLDAQKKEIVSEATVIITDYILHALATIIAVVIGCILCSLVWMLISVINHAPIIGTASRLAGIIFGVFEGVLLVWIIMYVISLTSLTEIGAQAYNQITENEFLLYLYNNNILMDFLK